MKPNSAQKKRVPWLPPLLVLLLIPLTSAAENWRLEVLGGSAYHARTPLTIEQQGEAEIDLDAKYHTRGFEAPPYYSIRLGRWKEDRAWELEMIHVKLFLKNKPPEVENFSISHGYNLFMLNRAWEKSKWIYRIGAGVVIAHPEITVRGRRLPEERGLLDEGYDLAGPALQAAVARRFALTEKLFASLEGKVTASYFDVPIRGGSAKGANIALHGLFGLGYLF